MSTCDDLEGNYPKFKTATAISLCKFETQLLKIVDRVLYFEPHFSAASIFINLFHFLILIRKPLRSSSINIIMASVAIFDMCSMLFKIKQTFGPSIEIIFDPCFQSKWYWNVFLDRILIMLKDHSQRSSTWLLFSIALIRTLVIRNPMKTEYEKLTKPPTSFLAIIVVSLVFCPISISTFLEYDIFSEKYKSTCNPKGVLSYYLYISDLFERNNEVILKYVTLVNAMVSNIIPCFLFPVVTFLLVKELWKNEINRGRLLSSKKVNDSIKSTQLVLLLTSMFFIAQFPIGIANGVSYFFDKNPGITKIFHEIMFLFSIMLVLNTISHFFICILISSRYRAEVKKVIFCGRKSIHVQQQITVSR
ncbi:G-protein coupled receptors family 1 profile domain-containing protein [Caenorhabditis elegans]|uniref:G-protein coupled receptors family 1 profile domain-containing protein n=1 Tax=Caenorhabditis elegans TaxID=6239 RepID=O61970_CAEEL|nr:G-protein coupled receptors family 1 profile domain-containing protein [Caenorhabditis elegans]CCD67271.1 G-protein coupled receptors family 1 profile domain-containing protein [Caenorhabditis elegans]|eukprot:NP_503804.2 Serpentine Receptor, class W [Caenorhabditis elegans]